MARRTDIGSPNATSEPSTSCLPTAKERAAAKRKRDRLREERALAGRRREAAAVKEMRDRFEVLCNVAFEAAAEQVRFAVGDTEVSKFVVFGENFQGRFEKEGPCTFDEMLIQVAKFVSGFKGYKARVESRTCSRNARSNEEAAEAEGVSYQTWVETRKGILVTWSS